MGRRQNGSEGSSADTAGIPKTLTGVRGLDEVLRGGLPTGALTLLNGGPGTGKTLLGLEFLYRGALEGHPGVVLSFEERSDILRRNALTLGWDLAPLEEQGKLAILDGRIDPQAVLSGAFDLHAMLAILQRMAETIGATRLLLDGPDAFLRLLDSPAKERAELYRVNDWVRDNGMTGVMSVKREHYDGGRYEFLDYLADCVIEVDQRVEEQIATRRLRVVKYRGSDYGRNEYPFAIYRDGLHIIPVTATALRHRGLGESVPSGVEGLDGILGGGFRRNSCNLVSGASGTGKTTVACSFVHAVCARGEKALYIDFEESEDALLSGMLSPGIDLRPAVDQGLLRFHSIMPEALGVEEHLVGAYDLIDTFAPPFLVVDAISACRRMGSAHAAFDYLLRLIDFCKSRGITTLLTNLSSSQSQDIEVTGIDLSSVIDTVILLRNREQDGELRRLLLVLKSRGRAHSSRCHEFHITDRGIRLPDLMGCGEGAS
ncbi:MAG: circadian clock protein KaiC [Planctomycetota bacterium]